MIITEKFNPNTTSFPVKGKPVNQPEIINVLVKTFKLNTEDVLIKLFSLQLLYFKSLTPTAFALSNRYIEETSSIMVGINNIEITPKGIQFFNDCLKNYYPTIISNIIDKAIIQNQKFLLNSDASSLKLEMEQVEFIYSEHKTDPDFMSKFIDEIKKRNLLSLFEIFNFNSELKSIFNKTYLEENLNKNDDTNPNANIQDIKKLKI